MSPCSLSHKPYSPALSEEPWLYVASHHVISHNLTLVKLLHGFASNYVCMFLGWTPTKIVRSRTATSIFERMIGNFEYFGANKVQLFFSETTGHKSFIYHG